MPPLARGLLHSVVVPLLSQMKIRAIETWRKSHLTAAQQKANIDLCFIRTFDRVQALQTGAFKIEIQCRPAIPKRSGHKCQMLLDGLLQ